MKKEKVKRSNKSRPTTRRFRRVAPDRVAKPQDMRPSNTKVRVTMYLDLDVLNYFKERAAAANAAPYQTQINSELRRIMEQNDNGAPYSSLLDDDRFIAAIAERVQAHRKPR